MGRAPCCDKGNVKRGPWSPEEDAILRSYVEMYGTGGNWIALPQKAGLKRCGKSCRLRWLNYLRPDIKHGGFTEEEDTIICSLYNSIGSRWSIIASKLPGRTDNDIKNYWNTKLKKKFTAGLITGAAAASSSRIHHRLPTPPPPPLPDHLQIIKAESFAMPSEDLLAQVYAFTAHLSPSTEEVSASSSSITVVDNNNNNNNNSSSSYNNSNNNNNSSSYNWSIDGNGGGDDAFFFSDLGFGCPMAGDLNYFSSTWGSNSEMKPQGVHQSLTSFLVSEMQDKEMN